MNQILVTCPLVWNIKMIEEDAFLPLASPNSTLSYSYVTLSH